MHTGFSDDFLLAFKGLKRSYAVSPNLQQSKLTVNGSVLSDTPNVRYLVAL